MKNIGDNLTCQRDEEIAELKKQLEEVRRKAFRAAFYAGKERMRATRAEKRITDLEAEIAAAAQEKE